MKNQHTPAPWHLGTNGDKCAKLHAICAGSTVIAKVYGRGFPVGEGWSEQSQADACLIVAAPKLLAMLKVAIATSDPALHKWVKEAREAIAQAEGRGA